MELGIAAVYVIALLTAIIAFVYAVYLAVWVKQQKNENKTIERIAGLIRAGADTFMRKEYTILAVFAGVLAVLIFLFLPQPVWKNEGGVTANLTMALSYIAGTIFSAIAGKIGIMVAALANARCAEAATEGIKPSFLIGFRGGAVMGLMVVGSCLLGVLGVLLLTGDSSMLLGFSFGASSLALFAKAGGGIFTKTADVSADLAGKVELGIPEDDPRNPAVIADNVGDN
ncbi:MAG TPA: sodium/proton-translocating pyrophosphatase, partial [Clostridia bacterium]|nr:sodium/proton-translocating pyrophosphatase [Clostridia bacterium]